MKVSTDGNSIIVALSERNLKTMAKAFALGVSPDLIRTQEDGRVVRIVVEPDAVHYKDASVERQKGAPEIHQLLEHEGK